MRLLFIATLQICLLAACQAPPLSLDGEEDENEAMPGFSWVVEHELAGMPRPGGRRDLAQDLAFLKEQRIDLLVSLTITPVGASELLAQDIDLLHLPIKDFAAPTLVQMNTFVETVERQLDEGWAVGVHCTAGRGRTGTMLAVYFVSTGMTAAEALAEIRRLRPGSVETRAQEEAIELYAAMLEKGGR